MRTFVTDQFRDLMELRTKIVGHHSKCRGMGFTFVDHGVETCECAKVFTYVKELVLSEIPRVYWTYYWKDLSVDQVYMSFLETYFANIKNALSSSLGVLFLGPNGVGKTTMMCEIGKEAITRGAGVYYTTTQRYISRLMSGKPTTLTPDTKVLLLDEIDKAYIKEGSDYVPKSFEDLIRNTISSGKVIVAATNETEEGLGEIFGQSTLSMVKRYLKLMPVEGEDFSDRRQENWDRALKAKPLDYFHPNIIKMAEQMYDLSMTVRH